MESQEGNGANLQTRVTINVPLKIVHCSDGVIEDIEEDNVEDVDCAPQSEVDPVSELN